MHRSLGGDKGRLGPAVGPERCTLKDKGCYQTFRSGTIHWTKATGARATWGASAPRGRNPDGRTGSSATRRATSTGPAPRPVRTSRTGASRGRRNREQRSK